MGIFAISDLMLQYLSDNNIMVLDNEFARECSAEYKLNLVDDEKFKQEFKMCLIHCKPNKPCYPKIYKFNSTAHKVRSIWIKSGYLFYYFSYYYSESVTIL